MVIGYNIRVFRCICDQCKARHDVLENEAEGIYNGAQAVRSLGWSYGKDKSVKCAACRRGSPNDHYSK
jgi:hypothetical protein